jgi:rubrerythrin
MGQILNVGEVVEFAIYIEQNGYKFYVETIKKFSDEKLTTLFQFLADEEVRHEKIFKELLKRTGTVTPHESYPGEYEAYMKDFLKTHALANDEALKKTLASVKTLDDAVRMALEFEKDSIVLFSMLKKHIDDDNKPYVENIIQEEITHIFKINQYKHGS